MNFLNSKKAATNKIIIIQDLSRMISSLFCNWDLFHSEFYELWKEFHLEKVLQLIEFNTVKYLELKRPVAIVSVLLGVNFISVERVPNTLLNNCNITLSYSI